MILFFVALTKDHQQDYDLLKQEYMSILTAFEIATRCAMATALQQGVNQFAPFLITRGRYELAEAQFKRVKEIGALIKEHALCFTSEK
jgi:hypothetical protein